MDVSAKVYNKFLIKLVSSELSCRPDYVCIVSFYIYENLGAMI